MGRGGPTEPVDDVIAPPPLPHLGAVHWERVVAVTHHPADDCSLATSSLFYPASRSATAAVFTVVAPTGVASLPLLLVLGIPVEGQLQGRLRCMKAADVLQLHRP